MAQENVQHPSREARQKCWNSRDAYYKCLDEAKVVDPSSPEAANICVKLRKQYHEGCQKSWVKNPLSSFFFFSDKI